jgi:hypothetical protein
MPKKSVQRIPKTVILVCPHCKKGTTANVCVDFSPQKFICPKCNAEVVTPMNSCCIICAFSKSGTKCPRELYMKAKVKGWEIR